VKNDKPLSDSPSFIRNEQKLNKRQPHMCNNQVSLNHCSCCYADTINFFVFRRNSAKLIDHDRHDMIYRFGVQVFKWCLQTKVICIGITSYFLIKFVDNQPMAEIANITTNNAFIDTVLVDCCIKCNDSVV
jgi:hypothetical protein